MTVTAPVVSIAQYTDFSREDLGELAWHLGHATVVGLPILPGFIIPTQSLRQVAEANQLWQKCGQLLSSLNYSNATAVALAAQQIQHALTHQRIPKQLDQSIRRAYRQLGKSSSAVVSLSPTHKPFTQQPILPRVVKSESEIMRTVLEMWASFFQPSVLADYGPTLTERSIIPGSVVFQIYPIASHAGTAHAHHDVVTIHHHQSDSMPLSDTHHTLITQLATKVKRRYWYPVTMEWRLCQQVPWILHIRPDTTSPAHQSTVLHSLTGMSLVRGGAQGHAQYLDQPDRHTHLQPGSILITPHLHQHFIPVLPHVAGIITVQPPTQSIAALLQQYGIPTLLVKTIPRTHLNTTLTVTLDADRGMAHFETSRLQAQSTDSNSNDKRDDLPLWTQLNLHSLPNTLPLTDGVLMDISSAVAGHALSQLDNAIAYVLTLSQHQPISVMVKTSTAATIEFGQRMNQLKWEVMAVHYLKNHLHQPIRWLISDIHSPSEWQLIQYSLNSNHHLDATIERWLNLEFPSLIFELQQYMTPSLSGVVLDSGTVQHWLTGYTPSIPGLRGPSLSASGWRDILLTMRQASLAEVGHLVPLWFHLDRYDQNLIKHIYPLVSGLILAPQTVPVVRQFMTTIETKGSYGHH